MSHVYGDPAILEGVRAEVAELLQKKAAWPSPEVGFLWPNCSVFFWASDNDMSCNRVHGVGPKASGLWNSRLEVG